MLEDAQGEVRRHVSPGERAPELFAERTEDAIRVLIARGSVSREINTNVSFAVNFFI